MLYMTEEEISLIRKKNLEILFNPQTIAVVGASRKKGSVGRAILRNIAFGDYEGTIYPINPNARSINSIKCYPNLSAVPETIDLVFIVVPAKFVIPVLKEAAELMVKSTVIITAGFREIGDSGKILENEIKDIANSVNMRLIGPNCMGILNTRNKMNGNFAPNPPIPGSIGFISQSGALGVVILDYALSLGLGFSKFVSLGNQADVNANNMIEHLGNDIDTDVILAYLESFEDPWDFIEIATETSRKKPIIIVKSGRTPQGAKAATSHTGALATAETTLTAILRRSGVIRVNSVEELFSCAAAFTKLELPKNDRVCIITNAGGPGTIAVDSLISHGMRISELTEESKNKLTEFLPEEASWQNPVDLLASAGPNEFRQALEVIMNDSNVDAIITIFVPPLMVNTLEVAREIDKFAKLHKKPILGVMMGKNELIESGIHYSFPIYDFPESAAKALMAMTEYSIWKNKPKRVYEKFDVTVNVEEIIKKAKKEGRENLEPMEVFEIMRGYGFKFPKSFIIKNEEELKDCVEEIGYPLVAKIGTSVIEHKTDEGGVILNIQNDKKLMSAFNRINKIFDRFDVEEEERKLLIQRYYEDGVEIALGISVDSQFGAMLMVGSGGVLIEVIDDIIFEKIPLTKNRAHEMIKSLKGYPLLIGYRGGEPVNIDKLEGYILRLSQLAFDNRDIIEMDVNPILALKDESIVLDARIKIKID